MEKLKLVLSIVGAVAIGLPAVLHAIRLIVAQIPGAPGDAALAKVEGLAQKIADLIGKLFPQSSK